jgi:hypothetical protein
MSREVAAAGDGPVRLALAALKANQAPFALPVMSFGRADLADAGEAFVTACNGVEVQRHIVAAVNSAPVLAAEVERLQGLLAAARVAVEALHERECYPSCRSVTHGHSCTCGAVSCNDDITELRRAVGLEPLPAALGCRNEPGS